jgi:hypothetical protein
MAILPVFAARDHRRGGPVKGVGGMAAMPSVGHATAKGSPSELIENTRQF